MGLMSFVSPARVPGRAAGGGEGMRHPVPLAIEDLAAATRLLRDRARLGGGTVLS
jgi:hypothetical protein